MMERVTEIMWRTTPDLLRVIANRLEKEWGKCHLGDEVPSVIVDWGDNNDSDLRLRISIHQEAMPRKEQP